MQSPGFDAEQFEQLVRPDVGFLLPYPGDHLRHRDIFERRELGQQMMELVDIAHRGAAEQRA